MGLNITTKHSLNIKIITYIPLSVQLNSKKWIYSLCTQEPFHNTECHRKSTYLHYMSTSQRNQSTHSDGKITHLFCPEQISYPRCTYTPTESCMRPRECYMCPAVFSKGLTWVQDGRWRWSEVLGVPTRDSPSHGFAVYTHRRVHHHPERLARSQASAAATNTRKHTHPSIYERWLRCSSTLTHTLYSVMKWWCTGHLKKRQY